MSSRSSRSCKDRFISICLPTLFLVFVEALEDVDVPELFGGMHVLVVVLEDVELDIVVDVRVCVLSVLLRLAREYT